MKYKSSIFDRKSLIKMYRENATRYISVLGYVGYKKVQNNFAVRDLAVSCHRVRSGVGRGGGYGGATPKSPKTFAPSLCTLRESLAMPL